MRLSGLAGGQGTATAYQSTSDADQTASEVDGEQSARDQDASDRDQSSNHDQAVADWKVGSRERRKRARRRATVAEQRARAASERDRTAWHRDLTAQAQDGAADRRDRDSAKIERKMASRGSSLRAALAHAAEIRASAARDRARASQDRAQAAADRERAAEEREAVIEDLRHAHLDELTGAFRRGSGEEALRDEIERARRSGGNLVLIFVDIDHLREVNNHEGHPAGDALLREVVATIRSKMRSYGPIIRYGGDEFICVIGEVDLGQAEHRFKVIQGALAASGNGGAVSVGLAELRPDDTLEDLIERADQAMLAARRER